MEFIIENKEAFDFFLHKIKNDKTSISSKDIKNFNINSSKSYQKFGNICLEKDLFGDWEVAVIDDKLDLFGNAISENKKLISRLKALWENGSKKIKFQDLMDLNIFTSATTLKIQNFKLTNDSFLVSTGYYNISLNDKNRNIDGLWLDSMINTETILDVLKDFTISTEELSKISEVNLNKLLENHFKNHFENIKKGGTSDKGLIDLIIGDLVYGIELKLAREVKKTTEADRAIGQIDRYKERFGDNFLVIIAGNNHDKKEKCVQELIKKIKNSKGFYYYLEGID